MEKYSNQRISGPVSAYITEINGKKYEFFGDIHFSFAGGCSQPCQDINDIIEGVDLSDPQGCWDISVFLSGLFTDAAKQGKWIDFYLEISYFKGEAAPSKDLVKKEVERVGYLNKLFYIFHTCFTKSNCDYSTTRFHYIDMRKEYIVGLPQLVEKLDEMSNRIKSIKASSHSVYRAYESYLTKKAIRSINTVLKMTDRTRNKKFDEIDALMKDFYFSTKPKNERLFILYLTSDNIYEDVKKLLKPSLKSVEDPLELMEVLLPANLIVNRNGKIMHRIRAQLEALENEGKGDIAKKITQYSIEEYNHQTNANKIIDPWKAVEVIYNRYIKGSLGSIESGTYILTKAKEEMRKSYMYGISNLLMDTYVLGRMFRTYPGKKHIDSYKSIVYAGQVHINTYVKFFEKYMGARFLKNIPNKEMDKKFKNKTVSPEDMENISRCLSVSAQNF